MIIGKNGTGKTTFMNILHGVLAVDINSIEENDFKSVKITLVDGKRKKTIKATKLEDERYPFSVIEYQISQRKFTLRLMGLQERRYPTSIRRRFQEEALNLRQELEDLVSVSSLSVYRLRHDDDYEVRDNRGTRVVSPVDYRLGQALRGLTQYQLGLSQKAREVSAKLQTDVLASILYGEEDAKDVGYELDFDKSEEQTRLTSAYAQLNSLNSEIRKKIRVHVNAIDETITSITGKVKSKEKSSDKKIVDIKPLEALRKTRRIIDLSLEAKKETQEIYAQIEKFLSIIKDFIKDKKFEFDSGSLVIKTTHGIVGHERLSSGEKQLIILLVEALLQGCRPHVFLADEPELSLHIAWQRMVIPAIKDLNPSAQIIAATHSPEVASKYSDSIFDMESLING
ncbi:ATP-binding protein [Halomonas sp. DP5Y7-2]|nr:ATP-binding protein [Halomonas sp. DP5Y7-2]